MAQVWVCLLWASHLYWVLSIQVCNVWHVCVCVCVYFEPLTFTMSLRCMHIVVHVYFDPLTFTGSLWCKVTVTHELWMACVFIKYFEPPPPHLYWVFMVHVCVEYGMCVCVYCEPLTFTGSLWYILSWNLTRSCNSRVQQLSMSLFNTWLQYL